ncbi:NrfD/PsrC family molybdoenzyme membrane anchor subunit [Nesterenkonia sp. NBAIMH1]|uniref:NrfD/PsrC family molybdoenzyme membrane anchor subunit n=1 Tax=Nesterenkonia sp. NBAIMH1 TaxID=2600320 RepID=UPI0011B49286|nr:NrfD/PsrC family molybdoenzyme membrane anchor subunit [Nesterenkonia sp. NBAIMH1]
MTTSQHDAYRPPEPPASGGRKRKTDEGGREVPVVEKPNFTSYYGRPVVKAPPWGDEIGAYLFLGGLAGGSSLLSVGAQLTGRRVLQRNARLTSLGAVSLGTVALIHDLGRPERFLYMLRTFKPTSPMSVGSWLLSTFSTMAGVTATIEADRLLGHRLPLGPGRRILRLAEVPAEAGTALLAAPLASYTGALLSDTAVPTWNAARDELPFVFVSSACMAASGAAMVTTPTAQTGPARSLAAVAAVGEVVSMKIMKKRMHPAEAEPLEQGPAGTMLKWAERLTIAGAAGSTLLGGRRTAAAASGLMMLSASALTRLGILRAGIASADDPRHTIEPQKARLAARRAQGIVDDSITTVS